MSIFSKVVAKPFICKIYLDFTGSLTPTNNLDSQTFFNSLSLFANWQRTHFGLKAVTLTETEKLTSSGSAYTQTLKIQFPNADELKSERIAQIKQTKFVRIELSNGISLIIGRNDFFQNKPIEITAQSTENFTTITFVNRSIFSIGNLQNIESSENDVDFYLQGELQYEL